jgi:hypothetical protein
MLWMEKDNIRNSSKLGSAPATDDVSSTKSSLKKSRRLAKASIEFSTPRDEDENESPLVLPPDVIGFLPEDDDVSTTTLAPSETDTLESSITATATFSVSSTSSPAPSFSSTATAIPTFFPFTAAPLPTTNHNNQLPELMAVGNTGNVGADDGIFPLQICQGDCDNDEECEEGLLCLQRKSNEPVPGCSGQPTSGMDYCIASSASTTSAPSESPMTMEEEDILVTAPVPSPMITATPTFIPSHTLSPTENSNGGVIIENAQGVAAASSHQPTFEFRGPPRTPQPTPESWKFFENYTLGLDNDDFDDFELHYVGNDNDFDVYPLDVCMGDCDTDDDCKGALQVRELGMIPDNNTVCVCASWIGPKSNTALWMRIDILNLAIHTVHTT